VEIHFHSDFGLGVANTINAVLAGAEVIHSTVLGIGERAGNTPMEETALALLTLYGIDVGIDFGKLNELAKLVQKLTGIEVPKNRPFIGDYAYNIESGIVTGWYKNVFQADPTIVYPVNPEFVGHEPPDIFMGKKSGLDNIEIWTQRLNIELTEDEELAVLKKVKQTSHDLKRVLTENEFRKIAESVTDDR
jgi:isopropylmalate/homocitrate/citramalate synthase